VWAQTCKQRRLRVGAGVGSGIHAACHGDVAADIVAQLAPACLHQPPRSYRVRIRAFKCDMEATVWGQREWANPKPRVLQVLWKEKPSLPTQNSSTLNLCANHELERVLVERPVGQAIPSILCAAHITRRVSLSARTCDTVTRVLHSNSRRPL
jgi:hypothetical protein